MGNRFDVISLGVSVVEVCINPSDPWAWAGLIGDTIDLIPFVTGVGEVIRSIKTIDRATDTVQIAKAIDFTEDAANIVKALDRSSGFTKSTARLGRKYMTDIRWVMVLILYLKNLEKLEELDQII